MDTPSVEDLRGSALFGEVPDGQLTEVAEWFETRLVDAGEVLAREGASGYAFMVLGTASAAVSHGDEVVRTLGPGDWFGEAAILGSGRRTATVTVTSAGTVWELFGTRFRELGQKFPDQQELIERVLSERQA
jgi:CRP-like cAMP-binding protein